MVVTSEALKLHPSVEETSSSTGDIWPLRFVIVKGFFLRTILAPGDGIWAIVGDGGGVLEA